MDATGFGELFDAHYGAVVAHARRRGSSWDDAQDVAADVFAVAWRRRGDIPEGFELAWLLGVARRVQANRWRGERRWRELLGRLAGTVAPHGEEMAVATGTDPRLSAALATLPARDREVLRLIAWDGLTHAEAGVVLGCSESSVSSRVARARARLRRALDAQGAWVVGGS